MPWDYDRYADSERKRRSVQFFPKTSVGKITRPTTIVDLHGKILVWYLPSLLLPARVVGLLPNSSDNSHSLQAQLNNAIVALKGPLQSKADKSWRSQGFLEPANSILGSGKLSVSVGTFMVGRKVRIPTYNDAALTTSLLI